MEPLGHGGLIVGVEVVRFVDEQDVTVLGKRNSPFLENRALKPQTSAIVELRILGGEQTPVVLQHLELLSFFAIA